MSIGPTLVPRKETIYDGPEVHAFKPKQLEEAKPISDKETVHEGEVPEFITRRFNMQQIAQAQRPQTETVHEGEIPHLFAKLGRIAQDLVMPDRETIYAGPDVKARRVEDVSYLAKGGSPSADEGLSKETVYDEKTFSAKRLDTSASRTLVTRLVQRASVRFFAVALLSLVELYMCWGNISVMISSGIMFVTFVTVGFYTLKLNLKALLLAIGIYVCTTLFMALNAIMGAGIFLMILPLLSRGFMIYNLLRTYGLLVDLHLLEAEIY
jgi:hypothetical protein